MNQMAVSIVLSNGEVVELGTHSFGLDITPDGIRVVNVEPILLASNMVNRPIGVRVRHPNGPILLEGEVQTPHVLAPFLVLAPGALKIACKPQDDQPLVLN